MKFCSSQSTMLDGFGAMRLCPMFQSQTDSPLSLPVALSCTPYACHCLSMSMFRMSLDLISIAFDSGWFPIKSPRCWYVLMLPCCKSPNKKLKIICRKSSPETGYPRLSSLRSGNLGITARSLMLLYQKTMPFAPPQQCRGHTEDQRQNHRMKYSYSNLRRWDVEHLLMYKIYKYY